MKKAKISRLMSLRNLVKEYCLIYELKINIFNNLKTGWKPAHIKVD